MKSNYIFKVSKCFDALQLLFFLMIELFLFECPTCPFEKSSVVFESFFDSLTRSFGLILYNFCPISGSSYFSQKTPVPFHGKWYLRTTNWTPGMIIATGLIIALRSFQCPKLENMKYKKSKIQHKFILIFLFF